MTTGSSGDGLERDIIMEFVLQEEMENKNRFFFIHNYGNVLL
jgi:hypothetical protein